MKKQLLLLSATFVAAGTMLAAPVVPEGFIRSERTAPHYERVDAPSRAEGETPFMYYTYAEDVQNAYSLNGSPKYVYLMFEIPQTDASQIAGSQITGVRYTAGTSDGGTSLIKKIEVFVTDDLTKLPEFTSSYTNTTEFSTTEVTLDTPYEITGDKPVYVGYRFKCVRGAYYIPTDNTPTEANTCIVGTAQTDTAVPEFAAYGDQIGALCLAARLEGDNLPKNIGAITELTMKGYFEPGQNVGYYLNIRNNGSNAIENIKVRTKLMSGEDVESTCSFETPIAASSSGSIYVGGIPNSGISKSTTDQLKLTSTLLEVNGVPVENESKAEGAFMSYEGAFKRAVVIEEGTGTWCGWCPRGIVMMEYFAQAHPDWIRIAVHGENSTYEDGTPDPAAVMNVPGYNGFLQKYTPGFPGAYANREIEVNVNGANAASYQPLVDNIQNVPTYCDLELTSQVTEDKQNIEITAKAKFALDSRDKHLMSFVVVEDGLGPFLQTNYFSGSGTEMGGWQDKGGKVPTVYNDVPRAIKNYPGLQNALPAKVEKDGEYEYKTTMSLGGANPECYRVVGMITNQKTGVIVNARQFSVGGSGIEETVAENSNVDIRVINGEIVVTGATNVAVYTLDGRRVGTTGLGSGIYIVNADGVSKKLMIK